MHSFTKQVARTLAIVMTAAAATVTFSQNLVLSQLGAGGVTETGGTAAYGHYIPRLNAAGKLSEAMMPGSLATAAKSPYLVFVDSVNGADASTSGTISSPFKTLNSAMTSYTYSTNAGIVYVLLPGTHQQATFNPSIIPAQAEFSIVGLDPYATVISGVTVTGNEDAKITLSGVTVSEFKHLEADALELRIINGAVVSNMVFGGSVKSVLKEAGCHANGSTGVYVEILLTKSYDIGYSPTNMWNVAVTNVEDALDVLALWVTALQTYTNRVQALEPYTNRVQALEPYTNRVQALEPYTNRVQALEPYTNRVQALEPYTNRVQALEPYTNRVIALEPYTNRVQALEPYTNRVIALEPYTNRVQALEPYTARVQALEPYTNRVQALEPYTNRVQALEPYTNRVQALEPYTNRVQALEPYTNRVQALEPYTNHIYAINPHNSLTPEWATTGTVFHAEAADASLALTAADGRTWVVADGDDALLYEVVTTKNMCVVARDGPALPRLLAGSVFTYGSKVYSDGKWRYSFTGPPGIFGTASDYAASSITLSGADNMYDTAQFMITHDGVPIFSSMGQLPLELNTLGIPGYAGSIVLDWVVQTNVYTLSKIDDLTGLYGYTNRVQALEPYTNRVIDLEHSTIFAANILAMGAWTNYFEIGEAGYPLLLGSEGSALGIDAGTVTLHTIGAIETNAVSTGPGFDVLSGNYTNTINLTNFRWGQHITNPIFPNIVPDAGNVPTNWPTSEPAMFLPTDGYTNEYARVNRWKLDEDSIKYVTPSNSISWLYLVFNSTSGVVRADILLGYGAGTIHAGVSTVTNLVYGQDLNGLTITGKVWDVNFAFDLSTDEYVVSTNMYTVDTLVPRADLEEVHGIATNALELALTALQPDATNGLASVVEHTESEHGVVDSGGFVGGASATSYSGGGAVGNSAIAVGGGAVGNSAVAEYGGGAVGLSAHAEYGGAVGNKALTSSGFAGGYKAMAALDNTGYGTGIDAIQLGTGWNPDANTLQIYDHKMMNADGSIPAERMAATLSGYATTGAVAAVQAEVEAATSPKLTMVPTGTTVISTDTTVQVVPTRGIYNLYVQGDSDISFDLSSIDITNNVARWETWIKVFAPGMTVGLPSTNAVQYLETPDLTTTTANELLQISWQAWMDGTSTLMQASMYGRVLGAHIPTPEELRLYHYGSTNIIESPDEWFVFDPGTKTITGYNYVEGRENVVIPWEIGGVAVEVLGVSAVSRRYSITNVVAGRSVLSIGGYAFVSCDSLTSIDLPAATSIGYQAFAGCTSLTSIDLPAATSIGYEAFANCISLTSVTIPAATSIGFGAFRGCGSLTSVTIPAATSIGFGAFDGCGSLTSIDLPAATSIRDEAFSFCYSLTSVYFGNAKPTEGDDIFVEVYGPVTIYYPDGAAAWNSVTTWGGMPTAPYTP